MQQLVVLAGPIASGKSTVAGLLAAQLAASGLEVAIVDLDDAAFAQRGVTDLAEMWRRSGVATAALVGGWFDAGVDIVVAHGPFFESDGYDRLFGVLTDKIAVTHAVLDVSFQAALARVADDPSRIWSKDPDFLRATRERFAERRDTLPSVDLDIDSEQASAEDIASHIASIAAGRVP